MSNRVGNCELVKEIAQGTEGPVYVGTDSSSGQAIVAKQYPRSLENETRAINEGKILNYVNSKFLVNLLYVLASENNIYLIYPKYAMSLLDYYSRFDSIAEELAQKWAYQILRGIQDMHVHKVMHRDINLQNVFVNETLDAVIINLNSSVFCPEGVASERYGTDEYMAPEVKAMSQYSFKVDIFSFGVLMGKLMRKVKTSNIAEDFVRLCVSPNEIDRPTADELLKHEFIQMHLANNICGNNPPVFQVNSINEHRVSYAVDVIFRLPDTPRGLPEGSVSYIKNELKVSIDCLYMAEHHVPKKYNLVFHLVNFFKEKISVFCEKVRVHAGQFNEEDKNRAKTLQIFLENSRASEIDIDSLKTALGILEETKKLISSSINTYHLQYFVLVAKEICENSEISSEKKRIVEQKKNLVLEQLRRRLQ